MIEGVKIVELKKNEDQRGWLAEIYREDEIDFRPAMGYLSITKYGAVRGPHEHKAQSDFFIFPGPGKFKLFLWDNRKNSPTYEKKFELEGGEGNEITVLVPPGVVHGYKCISKSGGLCVNLPDKLYAGKEKKEPIDEVRWEKDSASPFKIK